MLGKLLKGVFKKKFMENKKEKNQEPVIIRRAVIITDDAQFGIKPTIPAIIGPRSGTPLNKLAIASSPIK